MTLGRLRYKIRYDTSAQKLYVTVVQCQNLPKKDRNGYSDPFVRVFLMPGNFAELKTKMVKKELSPTFNEDFSFMIAPSDVQKKTIVFQVFDWDRFSKNDEMGEIQVPMWPPNLDLNVETDRWEELEKITSSNKPILKQSSSSHSSSSNSNPANIRPPTPSDKQCLHELRNQVQITVDPLKNELDTNKKTAIIKMFNKMDQNGNGFVEQAEFEEYLINQETPLSKERMGQLFKEIEKITRLDSKKEKKGITFQDMIKYFANEEILEDTVELNIDPANIGSIDDVSEYLPIANLTQTDACMTSLAHGLRRKDTVKDAMKDLVSRKTIRKAHLGDQEKQRWKPFSSFKRKVDRRTVMSAPSGIIRDYLPGIYSMTDIVNFDDLPPIKPFSSIVHGVKWIEGEAGKPSRLIFPDHFNGELETDIATCETLAYYGASLAESTTDNCTLDSRHVLQDFTYSGDYFESWVLQGGGGAAMEKHEFSHLDCPLTPMKKSGHFVLSKFINDEETIIEITGFQVPTRHTIYTPGGVLHTNNYLKGTWRTMLADGPVDEGKIERNGEPLRFSFKN